MAVPVLICLVSAAVFLVAAVDGEDDAEGEQGVLRVCDLAKGKSAADAGSSRELRKPETECGHSSGSS